MAAQTLQAITGLLKGLTTGLGQRRQNQMQERAVASQNQMNRQQMQMEMAKQAMNQKYMQAMMNKMNQGEQMISPEQLGPIAEAYGTTAPTAGISRSMLGPLTQAWAGQQQTRRLNAKEKKTQEKYIWQRANKLSSEIDKLTTDLNTKGWGMEPEEKQDMINRRQELYADMDYLQNFANEMSLALPLKVLRPEKEAMEAENEQAAPEPPSFGLGSIGEKLIQGGLGKLKQFIQ